MVWGNQAIQVNQMSVEDLRGLIDNVDVGISIIRDDKIEYANNSFLKIIGYSLDEIINKNCVFYAAKEEKNRLKKIKSEIKDSNQALLLEFWILTKEGKRKFVRNQLHPVQDEKSKNSFMILTYDITEKKQKETKVVASEFKKSGFLDYLTEHIVFYDTDMKIIWSNKIASDIQS